MRHALRFVLVTVLIWVGVGPVMGAAVADSSAEASLEAVRHLAQHDPALAQLLAARVVVTAVTTGDSHTCALTAGGGVKCWGMNTYGQLGDGTTTDSWTPVDVLGLESGVVAMSAGLDRTCAVTASGAAKCWGRNDDGQLGDGSTTDRHAPVDVSGMGAGVEAISAGWQHTCARTTSGGAKCWGYNGYGQLGDGTTDDRSTPGDVFGLTSGVAAIVAGGFHTCALTTTGGVRCWGSDDYGQVGSGTATSEHHTPVDVSGLTSGVASISVGQDHTCAVTDTGGAKCWGDNGTGQLGDGSTSERRTPVDVSGLMSGVASISAGYGFTCAVATSGSGLCWGRNFTGQLGNGTTEDQHTPVAVSGLGAADISAGSSHTCAVTGSGAAACWGDNTFGRLGDGTTTERHTPVQVVGLEGYARLYLPALLR